MQSAKNTSGASYHSLVNSFDHCQAKSRTSAISILTGAMLLLSPVLTSLTGCSREKSADVPSGKGLVAEFAAADTLLKHLPEKIFGFVQLDLSGPAYKRLTDSPWGKSQYLSFDNFPDGQAKLVDMLARAGFNVKDRAWLESNLKELVAFTGLTPDNHAYVAVAFRGTSKWEDKLSKLQEELKKEAPGLRDETFAKAKGFAYPIELPSTTGERKPHDIYVAWNGDIGVITHQKAAAEQAFAGNNKLPALLSSPNFGKATAGYPAGDHRIAVAFVDAKEFLSVGLPKLTAATGQTEASALPEGLKSMPVSALAWSMGMSDAPLNNIRVIYEPTDQKQQQLLTALKGSQADKTLNFVAGNPLLFLSIDGGTLVQVKDMLLAASGQAPSDEAKAALAAVNDVERIAITARVAPAGQSMLPIPDLSIILQSKNPDGTMSQIQKLVDSSAGSSGMPGMAWSDKQVQGVTAKTMTSPLGVGVFMTKLDNMVVAASTETQLAQMIDTHKGQGTALSKSLTSSMKDQLSGRPTVGNLYLNFNEVGSLMENVGGLISMYAPQSEEAKKLTSPEQIAEIRKLGVMVGSVSVDESVIELKSAYQATKPVA